MKIFVYTFFIVYGLSLTTHVPRVCAETLHYQETTGTISQDITWDIQQSETLARLIVTKPAESSTIEQDSRLGVVSWSLTNPGEGTSLKTRRLANTIYVEGTFKKKPIKKTIVIDGSPWCQPIAFALIPFAGSTQRSLIFWSINPGNMKATKMRAEKIGAETVPSGSDPKKSSGVTAEKIKVSLAQGPASKLWHAYYWFRTDNGTFLKYQGSNGPPGTPQTNTTLVTTL